MIIEVPFCYTAKMTPPRARNVRTVHVLDAVAVDVAEKAASEFPVAFVYTDNGIDVHGGYPEDIRFDGYRHWRAFRGRYFGGERADPVPAANLGGRVGLTERRACADSPFHFLHKIVQNMELDLPWHEELRGTIHEDDRDSRRAEIHARAADTAVFEGNIWEACGEPCWDFEPWKYEASARLATREQILGAPGKRVPMRFDFVRENADLVSGGVFGSIDILLPEAAVLPLATLRLRRRADEVVKYMAERAARLNLGQFKQYIAIRDAVHALDAGIVDDTLGKSLAALDEAIWPDSDIRFDKLTPLLQDWERERESGNPVIPAGVA